MAPVRRRTEGYGEESIYHELYFPDDKYFGRGQYSIFLRKNAFSPEKGFKYTYGNKDYGIAVHVTYDMKWNGKVIELCVYKEGTTRGVPIKGFLLPKGLDRTKEHEIIAYFYDWELTGVKLDDIELLELEEDAEIV
jgi:hypothetical protein